MLIKKIWNQYYISKYSANTRLDLHGRVFVIDNYLYEEVSIYPRWSCIDQDKLLMGYDTLADAAEALPEKIYVDGEVNKYSWSTAYDQKYTLSRYKVLKVTADTETDFVIVRKIKPDNLDGLFWNMPSINLRQDADTQYHYKMFPSTANYQFEDVTTAAKELYYQQLVTHSYHHKFKAPKRETHYICYHKDLLIPRYIRPNCKSKFVLKKYYEHAGRWIEVEDITPYMFKRQVIIAQLRPKDKRTFSYLIPVGAKVGAALYGFMNHRYDTPEPIKKILDKIEAGLLAA